jgi:hypothetical protein
MNKNNVNIKVDPFTPAQTSFPKCRECGNYHPYTAAGQCPVAAKQNLDAALKSKGSIKVTTFLEKVSKLLLEEDKDEELFKMLNTAINAWVIKKSKDSSKEK